MSNARTITTLSNSGMISGGNGGVELFGFAGTGGTGVVNASGATIGLLNNAAGGTISGGSGSIGGWGVSNLGIITTLTNSGIISGGGSHSSMTNAVGVANSGTIGTLTNSGTILGGRSGSGGVALLNYGTIGALSNSGMIFGEANGAGVANTDMITTLTNSGKIGGGEGATSRSGGIGCRTAARSPR